MKASRRKKISCLLLIGLMFIGLLSFKNIYAEGETGTPVTETETGETSETTVTTPSTESGASAAKSTISFSLPEDSSLAKIEGFEDSLTVDLYKVATISWNGSVAKYEFTAQSEFTNAIKVGGKDVEFYGMLSPEETDEQKAADISALNTVTNQCIETIFDPNNDFAVRSGFSPSASGKAKASISVDKDALYIAVIHNTNSNYLEKNIDGNYVSKANILDTGNISLFTPNLVFVVDDTKEYFLKPSLAPCLKIRKNLPEYAGNPVTFVFEIKDATSGKIIDYVSLSFKEHGTLETDLIRLPMDNPDQIITVTEVYDGASYTINGSQSVTKAIVVTGPNLFEFNNIKDDTHSHGYGFQNTYTKTSATEWSYEIEGDPYAPAQ